MLMGNLCWTNASWQQEFFLKLRSAVLFSRQAQVMPACHASLPTSDDDHWTLGCQVDLHFEEHSGVMQVPSGEWPIQQSQSWRCK